ncbi:SDR family oxidoreductase [Enterobacter cancerogenus]|uniref:SDR family oxidoreductase n=1 Tax=Enterobacter cancerogenus TaxID=69218 RepID=UPI0037F40F6C
MNTKRVLITGGSGGIGIAIASAFSAAGYRCVLTGRNMARLQAACESLNPPPEYLMGDIDLSNSKNVEQLIEECEHQGMLFDVLINCAGKEGGGRTEDIPYDYWENILKTNLSSVFYIVKNMLNKKLINPGGSIINIASTGGKQGVVYGAPYSASKHGVVGLSKSVGLELAKRNMDITVNAVCPGFVESGMAERVRENYARLHNISMDEVKRGIEHRIPLGRYILPKEVAALCLFLASDGARGITAQAINICGGLGNY